MCTVTFLPQSTDGFILTSNRDEAPSRNTLPPKQYLVDGVKLTYPKDTVAGGSWIGTSERKRVICLLNGGFIAHERATNYRMSRGVVVKDLLVAENALETIDTFSFEGVEPFTIIIVEYTKDIKLFELVWDGIKKHFVEKPFAPHIWSSSLLYTEEVKRKRERWFSEFLFKNMLPTSEEISNFHKTAGEGNPEIDLIMNRGFICTKSITQIIGNVKDVKMKYEEIPNF